DAIAAPNWSFRLAANACVPLGATVADAGLTTTLVACCCTGTTTELVTVTPSWSATVTWKVKVPNCVNVAVLLFAALVPLAPNVTPLGPAVTAQVYVRCDSPPSSAPRTLRSVVVPVVTGLGDAAAAVATVGASLLMVTLAVPWRPEPGSVAVTVKGPPDRKSAV